MTSILESFGNNSLAMITLLIVIPAMLLTTAYLFRRLESRERLLAIGKGVYQPISAEESYRRGRRIAVVLIAAGVGVILAFVLEAFAHHRKPVAAGLGIIPLTIGLGLLFDLRVQRRELRRSGLQPLSSADRNPSDR
jgi:mannitol-specific phosphotransferase system IIBC component